MRTIILCLVSSGMRASELLQLKISDLDNPSIHIRAETTKTGVGRTTYISQQAWDFLNASIVGKDKNDYVFYSNYRPLLSLVQLEKEFSELRDKTNLNKRYTTSIIHHITIHRLRAFCKTQASDACGKDFAEGLIGHEGYLSTYNVLTPEDKASKYKKDLEKRLTFKI